MRKENSIPLRTVHIASQNYLPEYRAARHLSSGSGPLGVRIVLGLLITPCCACMSTCMCACMHTYVHMNLVCAYTVKTYMNYAPQWQLKSGMNLCALGGALSRIRCSPENHLPCCPKPHEKLKCDSLALFMQKCSSLWIELKI